MTTKEEPSICRKCHRLFDPENENAPIGEHVFTKGFSLLCSECLSKFDDFYNKSTEVVK